MGVINFYWYKNPETGEMFSDQRMRGYEGKPLIRGGVECELDPDYVPPEKNREQHLNLAIINKNREVFEADRELVKKTKPKNIRFRDGHVEKYDPGKHN